MSDIADRADKPIAQAVSLALARLRRAPSLQSDGRCHFCDEPVPHEVLFCDVDCRDDYEREQAALRRAGKQFPRR